jgi:hypothetical protein
MLLSQPSTEEGIHPKTEEQIFQKIPWELRTRVLGRGRFKRSQENTDLFRNWSLKEDILV